jgi:hypothetical protein
MPPKVQDPEVTPPPGGRQRVTFDVDRIGPIVDSDQKFRFTIEVFRADNAFSHGGRLKVVRRIGKGQTVVFSINLPKQSHRVDPGLGQLRFIAEATVNGVVPVAHDPEQSFTLSFAALDIEGRIDGWKHLRYKHPIAAFV